MDFEKIFAKLISPFRGILSIFVRHAVGHIFVFLSFLFIASRFLPSEIGLYHSVLSLALSISVIGCFRLDVAVFQIKKSSIQGLFRNSFFLISCNSLIIFLASFYGFSLHKEYAYDSVVLSMFACATVFFAALNHWISNLFLRYRLFKEFGNLKFSYSIAFMIFVSFCILMELHVLFIFLADTLSRLTSCLYGLLTSKTQKLLELRSEKSSKHSFKVGEHKNLVVFGSLGAVANSLSSTILSLILATIFGLATAGYYAIIERLVFSPLGLLSGAVSQVLNAIYSDSYRQSSMKDLLNKNLILLCILFLIGGVLYIVLASVVPALYLIVFSDKDPLSIQIFEALLPLAIVAFVAGPYNMALTILGFQKLQLVWDMSRLITFYSFFTAVFASNLDVIRSLQLYAIMQIGFYLIFLLAVFVVLIKECKNDLHC